MEIGHCIVSYVQIWHHTASGNQNLLETQQWGQIVFFFEKRKKYTEYILWEMLYGKTITLIWKMSIQTILILGITGVLPTFFLFI